MNFSLALESKIFIGIKNPWKSLIFAELGLGKRCGGKICQRGARWACGGNPDSHRGKSCPERFRDGPFGSRPVPIFSGPKGRRNDFNANYY
jgi:hypothetical protein